MSLIIGLTGGIGSGKSTVSDLFSQLNIDVVDADVIARQVVQKGEPALAKISDYFGANILEHGELNRTKLRDIIFANEAKKDWLNELLHPIIRQEVLTQLSGVKGQYALLEAPLLFENKLESYCDYVVVVDVNESLQIKRVSNRDNATAKQVKSIMASQISRQQRLEKADFVIDNSGVSLQQLESSVIALDKQLRTLQ